MKSIKYTNKWNSEIEIAINNRSIPEILSEIQEEMLDPLAYVVVDDGIEVEPPVVDVLKEKLENLLKTDGAKSMAIDQRLEMVEDCIIEMAQELYK